MSGEIKCKEYTYTNENTGKTSTITRMWKNTSRRSEKIERFNKFLDDNKEWIINEKPSSKKISDKFNENVEEELKMSRPMIYTHYSKYCDSNNIPRQRRTRKPKEVKDEVEVNDDVSDKVNDVENLVKIEITTDN